MSEIEQTDNSVQIAQILMNAAKAIHGLDPESRIIEDLLKATYEEGRRDFDTVYSLSMLCFKWKKA